MDHPAFPTPSSMKQQQAQSQNALSSSSSTSSTPTKNSPSPPSKSLQNGLISGSVIPSTPTPTPMMTRTNSSSPRCRRPSPLRNNSICSDDVERAAGSMGTEEIEDEVNLSSEGGESMGLRGVGLGAGGSGMGMGLGLISPSPETKTKKPLIFSLTSTSSKQDRMPSRRDSGSEVEDVLFSSPFSGAMGSGKVQDEKRENDMDGLDFGFGSSRSREPEEESGKMMVDPKEEEGFVGAAPAVSTAGRKSNKGINYNPSINGNGYASNSNNNNSSISSGGKQHPTSSFIRPKPSFPRSAPLRPLTLTLSSSSGMNPNSSSPSSSLTLGGRYSTPHAGMMSSKSQSGGLGGRKSDQGRQKVIVPKKGWKMSFDLGLTQSELARVA